MFSNLIRQQARLALSTRITFPLQRQSLLARPTTAQILSQRTFSISRSLFEESPISQSADAHVPNTEYSTNQNATARSEIKGPHPRRRALYLSNLPYSAEEAEIRELFEPYGRITSVTFGTDGQGRQNGFGFVLFANAEDAAAALESGAEEPFVCLNRTIRVSYAKNMPKVILGKQQLPPSPTIHIANYPLPGDDRPLRQLLQDYQEQILRVNFMKDFVGNDTGKVFVQFSDQETATEVLEKFQETPFEGTNLKLYYAKDRPARQRQQSGAQVYDA